MSSSSARRSIREAEGSGLPDIGSTYAVSAPADHRSGAIQVEKTKRPDRAKAGPAEPGPARLYGLVFGAMLCLLGVAGFIYDSSFDTGSSLSSDYLAGTLLVNGWRNVVYVVSGLAAVALAGRAPRPTAFALGGFYLLLAIWGFIETDRGIGSILDVLPLGDRDNAFHLVIGVLGVGAGLIDGPRPKIKLPKPRRRKRAKPGPRKKPKPSGPAAGEGRDPTGPDAKRRIRSEGSTSSSSSSSA